MIEGETWKQAAKREVSEEVGIDQKSLKIKSFAGGISYTVEDKLKIVRFWNMTPIGDYKSKKTDPEVDIVKWLPIEEALKLLDHPKEKALLESNSSAFSQASGNNITISRKYEL